MKKRIIQAVIVLVFLMGMLAVGIAQSEQYNATNLEKEVCVNDENIINVNATIINAIDESIDLDTIRLEQMFVIDTYIDTETDDYIVVLEDNKGYVWECVNIELYLYEDVLVLMSDNHTEDVIDDVFIHYWISIE